MILYLPFSNETKFIPNIYTNNNTKKIIRKCYGLNLVNYNYIFCNISNRDIDYFNKGSQNYSLVYDIYCGKKEEIPIYVHQLDKTKYPVLRIKYLILPDYDYVDYDSEFYLIVDIEGSISGFTSKKSYFIAYILIMKNYKSTELELACLIQDLPKIQKNYEIFCYPMIDEDEYYPYDEINLMPFTTPNLNPKPFEVIIKKSIKAIEYFYYQTIKNIENYSDDNDNGNSQFIQISLSLMLLLLLI